MDYTAIVIALFAAILSGFSTAVIAALRDNKKEKIRKQEREQDHLKLEIKDLKIELYRLEKEYYNAIQELIGVKSELENALVQLNIIELRDVDSEY